MKPYENNLEHLLDELFRIDLLVRSYLEILREDLPEAVDEFRGLYISEAEIEQIQKNPGFGSRQGMLQELRIERLVMQIFNFHCAVYLLIVMNTS
jgi:hypothetical protein